MARSKKNWDHLVDLFGNYGIDIINGIYPGSGNTPGVKGNKGEFGNKGQKGEEGSGSKGTKGAKGERGVDGSKGNEGAKGSQGEASTILDFQGTVNTPGNLPTIGARGDVYYSLSDGIFYVYDGFDWIPLSIDAAKGEKGEEGADGEKGEPGADGNTGAGGDKGEPGDPGKDFDPVVLDDYYTSDQIDGLIQHFQPPEYAFHPQFYSDPTSVIKTGSVDFQNTDQLDPLWNPGAITIGQAVNIQNSPIPIDRLLVINYIVEDPGKLRGLDYTVVQHVISASAANTDQDAYFRYARPAQSIFGEWKKAHFDEDNYYDKPEVDDLIADRLALINVEDGPQDNQVDLQQKNITTDQVLSFARFEGSGAITVTSAPGNKIIIDTPSLNPLTFMGLIDLNEDPDVKLGAIPAAAGMYFIFTDSGVYTYTGDTVAVGDWLIYNDQTPGWEVISYAGSYGVAEVGLTSDGYLEDRGSSPAYPQIGIDMARWGREQPSIDSLANDHEFDFISNALDVVLPKVNEFQQSVEYDKRVYAESDVDGSTEPNPGGRFFINLAECYVQLERFDKTRFDLNSGFWVNATANSKFITVDTKVESRESAEYLSNYRLRVSPSSLADMAHDGFFRLTPFEEYGPSDQDALIYDSSAKSWVNGDPADGKYLSLKGGTVDGDVTIKGEVNIEGNIHMKGGTIDGIPDPVKGDDVVSKEWVLAQVGAVQGVPAGLIAFWASDSTIPSGWFAMNGQSYNRSQNPGMDAVIGQMHGATRGTIPNWSGHFIHQTERRDNTYDYNGGKPGQKIAAGTANSSRSGGIGTSEITHSHDTDGMRVYGFSVADNLGREALRPLDATSSARTSPEFPTTQHKHTHTLNNFDPHTRPKSVAGLWIIKGG
jgi:hypothetical protein